MFVDSAELGPVLLATVPFNLDQGQTGLACTGVNSPNVFNFLKQTVELEGHTLKVVGAPEYETQPPTTEYETQPSTTEYEEYEEAGSSNKSGLAIGLSLMFIVIVVAVAVLAYLQRHKLMKSIGEKVKDSSKKTEEPGPIASI